MINMDVPVKRALLSVSDKTGIVEFSKSLQELNIEIISTGGTSSFLNQHHIAHIEISDYTQFPEIFDGRVKTLHPRIHGGILARRDVDQDVMHQHNIKGIDLIVVNLYPFEKTVRQNCLLAEAIEQIDIGGPTLLRAAAKNYKFVTAIVDTDDYSPIITELKQQNGHITAATRFGLAKKVFLHTAKYDSMIANYLSYQPGEKDNLLPSLLSTQYVKKQDLRYGENPHQKAAFYVGDPQFGTIAHAEILQGKELSFNNIADADTALNCVRQFNQLGCVIVKHANPCGAADLANQLSAYEAAFNCDQLSAFGGIIAFNTALEITTAKKLLQQFVEVVLAPSFSSEVLKLFQHKPNIRLLQYQQGSMQKNLELKSVSGGILVQESDSAPIETATFSVVTKRSPSPAENEAAIFAWKVCKFVKSNAIVFAKDNRTIGIGAGQTSRVFSTRIAKLKAEAANLSTIGCALASDAFFPFRDSIDEAQAAGVSVIIQPGGSIKDDEIIAAANEANMAMIFTHTRHFRH